VLLVCAADGIAAWLQQQVSAFGYEVSLAHRGADATLLLEVAAPDLILVDLDVPDTDGLVLCAELRARTAAPIIAMHQGCWREDGILALHLGADDYVRLPADPYELEARLEAVLRRRSVPRVPPPPVGPALTFDPARHRVALDGRTIRLSIAEYDILERLANGHTLGVPRQDLEQQVQTALGTVMASLGRKLAVLPPPSPYILHGPQDRFQLRMPDTGATRGAAHLPHRVS